MKIIEVSYGVTVNIGNYESIRLDAKARVEDKETEEEALDKLKRWIDKESQLTIRQNNRD